MPTVSDTSWKQLSILLGQCSKFRTSPTHQGREQGKTILEEKRGMRQREGMKEGKINYIGGKRMIKGKIFIGKE